MGAGCTPSLARQVSLSSIRHRLAEVRQLLRGVPLAPEERELIGRMVDGLDSAVWECLGGTPLTSAERLTGSSAA